LAGKGRLDSPRPENLSGCCGRDGNAHPNGGKPPWSTKQKEKSNKEAAEVKAVHFLKNISEREMDMERQGPRSSYIYGHYVSIQTP
jgi:hypothetical protein